MTPFASWLLLITLFAGVFLAMNALYIDSLKQDTAKANRESERLRKALSEAQPPF